MKSIFVLSVLNIFIGNFAFADFACEQNGTSAEVVTTIGQDDTVRQLTTLNGALGANPNWQSGQSLGLDMKLALVLKPNTNFAIEYASQKNAAHDICRFERATLGFNDNELFEKAKEMFESGKSVRATGILDGYQYVSAAGIENAYLTVTAIESAE